MRGKFAHALEKRAEARASSALLPIGALLP